ncbi:MAG: ABC transporter permease subunit [Rhizobiales bacterium]|nr:ABC transporter permease subunit [Hyphomicrobiales bacterium]
MSSTTKKSSFIKSIFQAPPFRWTKKLLGKIGFSGRGLVIAVPTIWLLVFFLIPFLVIAKISLSEALIARPPYSSLLEWDSDGLLQISLNFGNYYYLIDDALYIIAYLNSFKIATISTIFCLLIGYPIAYYIAKSPENKRNILLMLIILPFWTSFLLRVYSWIGFFKANGIINAALLNLGIISEPLIMLQTDFAVYVGIVYTYLPFMILPLYSNLVKLDDILLEASADLGGRPMISFFKITLPLSVPGIIAGSMLVLIPAVGEFVIPALLGGPDTLMIGRVLWDEFFSNRDWPVASAVSIIMLVVLILPVMWIQNKQNSNLGES